MTHTSASQGQSASPFAMLTCGTAALVNSELIGLETILLDLMKKQSELTIDQLETQKTAADSSAKAAYNSTYDDAKNLFTQAATSFTSGAVSLGCGIGQYKSTTDVSNKMTEASTERSNLSDYQQALQNKACGKLNIAPNAADAAIGPDAGGVDPYAAAKARLRVGDFKAPGQPKVGSISDEDKRAIDAMDQRADVDAALVQVKSKMEIASNTEEAASNELNVKQARWKMGTDMATQAVNAVGQGVQGWFTIDKAKNQYVSGIEQAVLQQAQSGTSQTQQQTQQFNDQALQGIQVLRGIEDANRYQG